MRPQDGAVLDMLGREFEVIVDEPDEDGHGYIGVRCTICDAALRLSDDAMQDHQCAPVECPDCEGTGLVFDHTNYWGEAEDRNCAFCAATGAVDPIRLLP